MKDHQLIHCIMIDCSTLYSIQISADEREREGVDEDDTNCWHDSASVVCVEESDRRCEGREGIRIWRDSRAPGGCFRHQYYCYIICVVFIAIN